MRTLCLAGLLASSTLAAPALAQADAPSADAAPDSATVLVHQAFAEVFDVPAIELAFAITYAGPDTSFTDSGVAVTHLDPDTETVRFRIDHDDGETSISTLDAETFQVESPRTRRVYVDSTRAAFDETMLSVLPVHPAFGTSLFYFAQAADRQLVGDDAVGGQPCTRATYTVQNENGPFTLSVCFDAVTRVPSEIAFVDDSDEDITITVSEIGSIEIPPDDTFEIPLREGYTRVPYDGSTEPLLALGAPAPAFALPDADGAPVELADFRGRYVLVDFWGTWCAPCVEAIPHVDSLAQAYPDLAVLGLASYEYEDVDPTAFLRARGGTYPTLLADEPTIEAWRVRAFPTYYVVDPEGTVVFASVPDRDPEAQAQLDAFLATLFPE